MIIPNSNLMHRRNSQQHSGYTATSKRFPSLGIRYSFIWGHPRSRICSRFMREVTSALLQGRFTLLRPSLLENRGTLKAWTSVLPLSGMPWVTSLGLFVKKFGFRDPLRGDSKQGSFGFRSFLPFLFSTVFSKSFPSLLCFVTVHHLKQ
jgi:hypothetical protein